MITEQSERMENVVAPKDSLNKKANQHVVNAPNSVKLVSDLLIINVQVVKENITENQLKAPVFAEINSLPMKFYQVELRFVSEKIRKKSINVWKEDVMIYSRTV